MTVGAIALIASHAHAQWGPEQLITNSSSSPIEVAPIDRNGDGVMDFAVAAVGSSAFNATGDEINAYVATGATYTLQTLFGPAGNSAFLNPGNVHTADLDGDGDLDIIGAAFGNAFPFGFGGGNSLRVLRNNGNGSFSLTYTNNNVPGLWDVATADFDGDGVLDVMYSLGGGFDQIGWQKGNGNCTFQPQNGAQAPATGTTFGNEPRDIHLDDVDGDGDADLVVCYNLSNELVWFRNNGSGASWTRLVIESNAPGVRKAVTGDVDGDGINDIIRTSTGNGQVAAFLGTGGGGFGAKQVLHTFATSTTGGGAGSNEPQGPRGIDIGDFDLDGDLDVVTASQIGGLLSLHENLGGGSFASPVSIATAFTDISFVKLSDIDGDSDLDVVACSPRTGKVAWYQQTSTPVGVASRVPFGQGCGDSFESFYEQLSQTQMDLANTRVTATFNGAGYDVTTTSGVAIAPVGSVGTASVMNVGDDTWLPTMFSGGTLGIAVWGNCAISIGGFPISLQNAFTPNVSQILDTSVPIISAWTDLQPASGGGSGTVYYEENAAGTLGMVTYENVQGWNVVGTQNTVQFTYEATTGDFSITFGALATNNPEEWVIGYSPAGPSADPGATDINAGPFSFGVTDQGALTLDSNPPRLGQSWDFTTSNLGGNLGSFIFFGDTQVNPGTSLAILGAPGCSAYTNANLIALLAPAGSLSVVVPNNAGLIGYALSCQATTGTGANTLGLVTSNGLQAVVGN